MRKRLEVSIPRKSGWSALACGFLGASALLRLGFYLAGQGQGPLQLWLPVGAAAVFLAGMALGGRWAKAGCGLATLLGVLFFIIKAQGFAPLHRILCTLLYLTVLALFLLTLYGFLPTKKLLYPLFGLPLLAHLGMDLWQGLSPDYGPGEWGGLPEVSVLCIMAGLLCLSVGLKAEKCPPPAKTPLERAEGQSPPL